MKSMLPLHLFTALLATSASLSWADVKPARLFADHMVIQRDTAAPIWGWADAGEKVVVTGSWGATAEATADAEGSWRVALKTPKAGGPHTITLKGNNTVELTDVLSGDVWLCSGQSNMAWPVSKALNPEQEKADANYPQIRHFLVARTPSLTPSADCEGAWSVCAPETVLGFSATAYFTGRELHRQLNVPIGLVTSTIGGTCVEAWTPPADQLDDPFAKERKDPLDLRGKTYSAEKAKVKYDAAMVKWKAQAAQAKAEKKRGPRAPRLQTDPRLSPNYPGNLYNGMIHPLLTYGIKGAVWYQGESNAKSVESSAHYRVQLARMIRSWRKGWGEDFPFYTVQLPNFKKPVAVPVDANATWPVIRESFVHVAQNTPGVATACTIDVGEAGNIHPYNKQEVGRRMALTILNKTYGKDSPTTPFMDGFTVRGDTVEIRFTYSGTGLEAKGGGSLTHFAIAGADKQFVAAEAKIVSRGGTDVVVVRADGVKKPVAVRYAWADNPEGCNLFSKEGLPASPFRTDTGELSGE